MERARNLAISEAPPPGAANSRELSGCCQSRRRQRQGPLEPVDVLPGAFGWAGSGGRNVGCRPRPWWALYRIVDGSVCALLRLVRRWSLSCGLVATPISTEPDLLLFLPTLPAGAPSKQSHFGFISAWEVQRPICEPIDSESLALPPTTFFPQRPRPLSCTQPSLARLEDPAPRLSAQRLSMHR